MPFLRNQWYAGAFTEELEEGPVSRTLLGQAVVLYRSEDGKVIALGDRCPHRFAPLHLGKVFGDAIRCPYHGLRFGPGGNCVHNPLGDGHVPRVAKVPAYPVYERDGIIWLWFGDEAADESRVVAFDEFNHNDRWTTIQGYIPVSANYTLVADNLLDLSHAEFLHPNLATEGFNKRVQLTVTREGDAIIADNRRPNEPISNAFRLNMGGDKAPDRVDHRSVVRWEAPATLTLRIGATPVGQSEGGVMTFQAHLVTPETETSCHYFWKLARDFKIGDAEHSAKMKAVVDGAFRTEDKPMIEAQQKNLGAAAFDAMRPTLLKTDEAATRARRILEEKLIAQACAS